MAPTNRPVPELKKAEAQPPQASELEYSGQAAPPRKTLKYHALAEVVLRVLLFAFALASVLFIVTGKQTKLVPTPFPPYRISRSGKFTDSSGLIYYVVALSAACLYSIISTLLSLVAMFKKGSRSSKLVSSHLVLLDVLMLGIIASASGAAAAISYIGYKGNSNVNWNAICSIYNRFCRHIGISILASLFASLVLMFLISLSFFTLSRKISK